VPEWTRNTEGTTAVPAAEGAGDEGEGDLNALGLQGEGEARSRPTEARMRSGKNPILLVGVWTVVVRRNEPDDAAAAPEQAEQPPRQGR